MSKIKTVLFVLFAVFFIQLVSAQFPTDIQYQSIAPPVLELPNYLESVTDASVLDAIEITRITDYYEPWDWYPVHEYPKTQVWNADQTLIRIRAWKIIDATTFEDVQDLSGSIYPCYWSNTDPDLIWSFKDNGDVKTHRVSTNITETVANIAGYEFVKLGPGEGNIDKNDQYVALVGKNGTDLDVIIFDLQTLQIVHTETFAGAWGNGGESFPQYIDWISISQSGDYVVIMWNHSTTSENNPYNTHYGVEVYNTLDMQYQNRIMSYGNHGDLGYAVDGEEVLVQFYGWYGNGTLYMHKLDGSGSTLLTTNTDFGISGHVSCRNLNRPGWAYVVHSSAAQTGQMVAVKLDESGLVEHFGHHFSSSTSYDKAPMTVASPNGDKVFFRSDFGDSANPDLSYCFESKVAYEGGITLDLKTILQGPYDEDSQLMNDELRANNEIPLTEPFTSLGFNHVNGGGESTTQPVLDLLGNNAIVDWIFVELRDGNSPSTILATQSALLQRDGNIVSLDGTSLLEIDGVFVSDVIVVLRHRNHFGVRVLDLYSTDQIISIDFTDPATNMFGVQPMFDLGSVNAMIAGDANLDGQINPVDKNIFWRVENGQEFDYLNTKADFNLDGIVNPVDKNLYWRLNNSRVEQVD